MPEKLFSIPLYWFLNILLKIERCCKAKKPRFSSKKQSFSSVGVRGFEPPTPCSQSRCANRTAPHPEIYFAYSLWVSDGT